MAEFYAVLNENFHMLFAILLSIVRLTLRHTVKNFCDNMTSFLFRINKRHTETQQHDKVCIN